MKCYCESGKDFDICCEPFLLNKQKAASAEELMRSRYSAYATVNMDYIEQTQTFKEGDFDRESATQWAKESEWLGLEILNTEKGLADDSEGIVEFVAHFKNSDGEQRHHEIAHFIKKEGWLFQSGHHPELKTYRREKPKVGRNEPCPCGSGKKYKKCCG